MKTQLHSSPLFTPSYQILDRFRQILIRFKKQCSFEMFDRLSFVSYRRRPTLRNVLVKTVLRADDNGTVPAAFTQCSKSSCSTSKHSTTSTNFNSSNSQHKILKPIKSNSVNVLYLISCKQSKQPGLGSRQNYVIAAALESTEI